VATIRFNSKPTIVSSSSDKNENVSFIYKDVHLDLKTTNSVGSGTNVVKSRDIAVDLDIKAIKNSVRNILTTRPGLKIFNPIFGCNLENYLFEAITEFNASLLGNTLLEAIKRFEKRVNVLQINIYPRPDENVYSVSMVLQYPNLKNDINVDLILGLNELQII